MVAFGQGWSVALSILNLCLISAIMAIGVNIQWGYAGLFNVGVMGFAALGGLASVIISMPAVYEARSAGGGGVLIGLLILVATVFISVLGWKKLKKRKVLAYWFVFTTGLTGYCLGRIFCTCRQCHRSSQPFSIRLSWWFWPANTFCLAGGRAFSSRCGICNWKGRFRATI